MKDRKSRLWDEKWLEDYIDSMGPEWRLAYEEFERKKLLKKEPEDDSVVWYGYKPTQ